MERIRVEVIWEAEDGTLDDLENEGGDVTLVKAALVAVEDAAAAPATAQASVNSSREEV